MGANKKEAIRAFQMQLTKLDQLTYRQAETWKAFTIDLIKQHIGPNSHFLDIFSSHYNIFYGAEYLAEDKARAKELISNCIQYLETNSVPEPAKTNVFARISDTWGTFWIGLIVTLVGGTGYTWGDYLAKNRIDQEKIELRNEVKVLKRENDRLRSRLSLIQSSQHKTGKTHQANKK